MAYLIPTIAASAYSAYSFYNFSKYFNKTDSIAEKLNAFPARKTSYKVAILIIQSGFLWTSLNSIAVCGGSIYSLVTGQQIFINTNLFMRTLIISSKMSFSTLVISIPFLLYSRIWQVY